MSKPPIAFVVLVISVAGLVGTLADVQRWKEQREINANVVETLEAVVTNAVGGTCSIGGTQ